jgi:formylmethanofuran dehydrogenase subunit E
MAFRDPDPLEDHPRPELVECGMCRRSVPSSETLRIGGRTLCFGCAAGWFEDEEDEPLDP